MSERLSRIVNHPSFKPICFSVAGATVGLGVGFILGRRHPVKVHVIPELDYEELDTYLETVEGKEDSNDDEIVVPAPPPEHSSGRVVTGAEMVAETLKREMTSTHQQEPEVVADTDAEFAASDEEWDYDKEVALRNSNQPYVIHYDEFFAKEMEDVGYLQMVLTYYAGDNIMTDSEDHPIYNFEQIVGELKFGHGSKGDPNTFYVRNDKRKAEYEITRDSGHFAEEVYGISLENGGERAKRIAHSRVDRFRPDD